MNENNNKELHKSVINWYIPTYGKPLLNPLFTSEKC